MLLTGLTLFPPPLADSAIKHQTFISPPFNMSRMTWIKPSFLWMMYRSGWGTKEGQEVTLALRVRRGFFETLLAEAVASTWDRESAGYTLSR